MKTLPRWFLALCAITLFSERVLDLLCLNLHILLFVMTCCELLFASFYILCSKEGPHYSPLIFPFHDCARTNLHWCGPKSQLHLRSGQVVFVGPGCEISSSLGRTSQLSFLNQKLLPGVGKRETDRLVNQVDSAMPSRWNPSHQFYWIPGLAQRCTATLSAVTCRFSSWNNIFSQISKVAAKCNVQKVAWKIQSKWEPQPCFLLGEESICAPSRAMDFKVQPDFLALWKSLLLHWGKLRCLDAEGFPDSNWWSWTW